MTARYDMAMTRPRNAMFNNGLRMEGRHIICVIDGVCLPSHHITPHHTTAHHRTSPHFTARHDTPQREAILMARKPPGPGAPARGKRVPLLIMIVHGKPMGGPRP